MQNLPVVVLALLFSLFGGPVLAKKSQKSHLQKQKMEIKAWKKRKDAMAPLRLKELVEENDQLKTDNYRLMEELRSSKETVERLMELKTYLKLQSDEQKVCDEARSQADSCVRLAQGTDGLGEGDWVVGKDGKSHIKASFSRFR